MYRFAVALALSFALFASAASATQVRSITPLHTATGAFDGFRVVTSIGALDGKDRILELRRANLPANIRNGTALEIQSYINQWLADALAGYATKCEVYVRNANPLDVLAMCSTRPIPPEWWLPPVDDMQ